MCLLNRTRVKDYLHDSENWPRSPFNLSNFVRLSSTLRILDFHSISIIYVETSGHELRTVWRRSKLKNKIWHFGHNRHIALLKRTQNKLNGLQCFHWQNTLKQFLQFLRDFVHGTRWTSPPFYKFVSVMNDVKLLWTTTVLSDKLDISLRPSKSIGQTQLDILRDVIVQTFLFVVRPVSRVLQVGIKIS